MKMPTQETMKKRFWELKAKQEKLRAKVDPVRAERDKLVAKQAKELEAADKKVAKAEEGLFVGLSAGGTMAETKWCWSAAIQPLLNSRLKRASSSFVIFSFSYLLPSQ